jgi:hypothetical protein
VTLVADFARRPRAYQAHAADVEWQAELQAEIQANGLPPAEAAAREAEIRAAMLTERPRFARWLFSGRPHPVGLVLLQRISERMCASSDPSKGVSGLYCPQRPGRPIAAILLSISHHDPGGSAWHEAAHHLHFTQKERVDAIILEAFSRVTVPSCGICAENHREFFAETMFASVRHPELLEERDPIGAQMIRDVLAAVGLA